MYKNIHKLCNNFNIKKVTITFLFFIILCVFPLKLSAVESNYLSGFSDNYQILNADTAFIDFYDNNKKLIILHGNVKIKSGNIKLSAEELFLDEFKNTIYSNKKIIITDKDAIFTSDKFNYNFKTGNGILNKSSFKIASVYVKAKKIIFSKKRKKNKTKNKIKLIKARLTTCDLEHPHYSIVVNKLTLSNNTTLSGLNNIIYIKKIPVFYFPYFSKNIKITRFELFPLYSNKNGIVLQSNFNFDINKNRLGTLMNDFYKKNNFGHGLKYNINYENIKADIFSYYIDSYQIAKEPNSEIRSYEPLLPKKERWKIHSFVDYNIKNNLEFKLDYQNLSDNYFNKDFERRGTNRVINEFQNEIGISQLKSNLLWYAKSKIYNVYNDTSAEFTKTKYTIPDVKLLLNDINMRNNLFYFKPAIEFNRINYKDSGTVNIIKIENSLEKNIFNYYNNKLTLGTILYNEWNFFYGDTEVSNNKNTQINLNASYVNAMFKNLSIKFYYINQMNLNLHTTVKNKLFFNFTYYINTLYIYGTTAYNFDPINNSKYDQFHSILNYNFKNQHIFSDCYYDLDNGKLKILSFSHSLKKDKHNFIKNTFNYINKLSNNKNDLYHLSTKLSFQLPLTFKTQNKKKNWSIEYEQVLDINEKYIKEKTITLSKKMHCTTAKIQYHIDKPDEEEILVMFNLNAFPGKNLGLSSDITR